MDIDIKCQNSGIFEDKADEKNLVCTINCKGQRGSVPTLRTEEAVLRASLHRELPPAGHGIKGKGTKLPVSVMFPSQSLHQHSNWHWFPASATFSAWEPGQKLWIWARVHFVVFKQCRGKDVDPWQIAKHPSFSGVSLGLGVDVKLQPRRRPIWHIYNLKQLSSSHLGRSVPFRIRQSKGEFENPISRFLVFFLILLDPSPHSWT